MKKTKPECCNYVKSLFYFNDKRNEHAAKQPMSFERFCSRNISIRCTDWLSVSASGK